MLEAQPSETQAEAQRNAYVSCLHPLPSLSLCLSPCILSHSPLPSPPPPLFLPTIIYLSLVQSPVYSVQNRYTTLSSPLSIHSSPCHSETGCKMSHHVWLGRYVSQTWGGGCTSHKLCVEFLSRRG